MKWTGWRVRDSTFERRVVIFGAPKNLLLRVADDRGTEAAKTQWTDLVSCGNASCSNDPDVLDANSYRACLQAQCGSRYNTCFGGAGQTPPPTNPPSSGSKLCMTNWKGIVPSAPMASL